MDKNINANDEYYSPTKYQLMPKLVEVNKKSLIKNIVEEENKFAPKCKTELCKKFQNKLLSIWF